MKQERCNVPHVTSYCCCDSQEEEEKESLAWKVLSEEQTQALKELTVHELEV